jgi:non-heme chloroperoxidase
MENKGPVLILIHDWFTKPDQEWRAQVAFLKNSYRIHTFTLEGHNKIYSPRLWKNSVMETNRKHLRDFLRHQEEPVFIVTHGISGIIALQTALEFPARIRSMVLINPRPSYKDIRFYSLARFMPDFMIAIGLLMFDPHRIFGNPVSRVKNQLKILPAKYARLYMKDLSRINLSDDLRNIQVRTCLILGDLDRSTDLESLILLNDSLPASHMIRYSNLGHNPHLENPQIINHIISDFFKKSDGLLGRSIGGIKGFLKNLFRKQPRSPEDSEPNEIAAPDNEEPGNSSGSESI